MKTLILKTAHDLFINNGIQLYTMSDLSRHLGISKKTIYKYFETKEDLVAQVLNLYLEEQSQNIQRYTIQHNGNTIKEVIGIVLAISHLCKVTSPHFFSDLGKHFPPLWEHLNDTMSRMCHLPLVQLMERGITEGVFRGNLHPSVLMTMWQKHITSDCEYAANLMNDYSKEEVFRQGVYLLIYGIIAPHAAAEAEKSLIEMVDQKSSEQFVY